MKNSNATTLANLAGKLIQVEDDSDEELLLSWNYLPFGVEVQVNQPLVTGCLVTRKCRDGSLSANNKIWIDFKFGRLPSFCTICGVLNHGTKNCLLKEGKQFQVSQNVLVPIFWGGLELVLNLLHLLFNIGWIRLLLCGK